MLTEWCRLKRCPVPTVSRISSIVNSSPMLLNISAGLRLRQRNKNKCQEYCEDDVSHPIDNLDDSFSFFFIHILCQWRNMVFPLLTLQKYSQDITDVLRW